MEKHNACILTDNGWVELDHNKKYSVNCVKIKLHNEILQSNFYKLKEGIFWPKVKKIDNYVSIMGDKKDIIAYYETEYISNILRYPEFTPKQFKEALLFLCDVCQYCYSNNYYLRTHLWNVSFVRGNPYLIDIRDFETLSSQSWKVIFIGHFTDKLSIHTPINANKFVNNYDNILKLFENCNNNLNEIKNIVNKIDIVGSSDETWSNYHGDRCNFLYESNKFDENLYNKIKLFKGGSDSELKSLNLFKFIENINPKSIIEMGCNNGLYTFGASKFGPSIGIDYDKKSIDEANNLNKKFKRDVNFIYFDLLNDKKLSIKYGKDGCYDTIIDRFKSELLIAPAIIHHLFTQCQSTDKIISIFNSFAKKYMIIEQIPNTVPENNLKKSLGKYNWKIIDESPSCPDPRKWLLCNKIE